MKVTDRLRAEFTRAMARRFAAGHGGAPTWVLRDSRSPDLLWLPRRDNEARIGVLDFHDAMMGPARLDVASLLQDARVDVPEPLEAELFSRYVRGTVRRRRHFDMAASRRIYATLAAQRATNLGFSSGSTGATASRNICVTCRGFGDLQPVARASRRSRRWGLVCCQRAAGTDERL